MWKSVSSSKLKNAAVTVSAAQPTFGASFGSRSARSAWRALSAARAASIAADTALATPPSTEGSTAPLTLWGNRSGSNVAITFSDTIVQAIADKRMAAG